MVRATRFFLQAFLCWVFFNSSSCDSNKNEPGPVSGTLQMSAIHAGTVNLNLNSSTSNTGIPTDATLVVDFSAALDTASVRKGVTLQNNGSDVALKFDFLNNNRSFSVKPVAFLSSNQKYDLVVGNTMKGKSGETFAGVTVSFTTITASLNLVSWTIDGVDKSVLPVIQDISQQPSLVFNFSAPLDPQTVSTSSISLSGKNPGALSFSLSDENKKLTVTSANKLADLSKYTIVLSNAIKGTNAESFIGFSQAFYTAPDATPKFPELSDDALLDLVQKQTLKYFYDFAHPASGMARERNTSGNTVTSGGSGFGIMAIVAGMSRNFIPRTDGINHLNKVVTFLEKADRFHGAWSHWIDGNTGKVIPFSPKDDGGDLVETSFLIQGLLTFRQYLQASDTVGNNLINRITRLYEGVEWDWYRKNNENVLYWHWSPDYNWDMNFPMYGYFEEQITYFLAAASPTHSIPKEVYTNGYGKNGAIVKNNTYYTYKLPLETPSPLFWVQYSYLGLNPHFSDDYANYWEQNVNASLINHAYCVANPNHYVGYSDACWGLTASDEQNGYSAHSPSNDNGTITPTAALSSFPYTPDESMKALKFFYYTLGDRLWGPYGFYDAFNLTEGWYADSYLAIDQGPIVVMIENYRTGLLWDLFMSAPEVQDGFNKLSFH